MILKLSNKNVFDYLLERNLCNSQELEKVQTEPIVAKNFNLLVTLSYGRKLLIKQERADRGGNTAGEFLGEWRIQEFIQQFSELNYLSDYLPKVQYFDRENSILVFNYLDDYRDLMDFYIKEKLFSSQVASAIAKIIAKIHRDTYKCKEYQQFFSQKTAHLSSQNVSNIIQGLESIGPEIFGIVPTDGLKFFALYQRYESLGQAMKQLAETYTSCCLIHNDLKLNNILLQNSWQQTIDDDKTIRLIDWERSVWGDPALDLGMLVGGYLQIWLNSLVISKSLRIEESLRLATVPLELLQPSLSALIQAYLNTFPQILEDRPDFIQKVMQFSGFALIGQIQAVIQYQKTFSNTGIAMLQVAKSLLCRPEPSIFTVFGTSEAELTSQFSRFAPLV